MSLRVCSGWMCWPLGLRSVSAGVQVLGSPAVRGRVNQKAALIIQIGFLASLIKDLHFHDLNSFKGPV